MRRLCGLVLLTTFRALLFLARDEPLKSVDMQMKGSQCDIRNYRALDETSMKRPSEKIEEASGFQEIHGTGHRVDDRRKERRSLQWDPAIFQIENGNDDLKA